MKSDICDRLGCDFPLFAFSHCRDVIAQVSKAGGFGVLGAAGCAADITGDELVGVDDLLELIAAWGLNGSPADVNGDGVVDTLDLLLILAGWGACP